MGHHHTEGFSDNTLRTLTNLTFREGQKMFVVMMIVVFQDFRIMLSVEISPPQQ